ncbi:MAG: DnaD domain protein [Oscillospiraceae bacterium]|nr:DnaD domain protein [Oscillospiraceae bacterium]
MNNTRLSLRSPGALVLNEQDADTLLRLCDGDCALLYIYLLRSGGLLEEKTASDSLHMSIERLRLCADRLRREGLLSEGATVLPAPADELPEYSAEELSRRSAEDKNWAALVQETQRVMGKVLNRPDLNTLFGIYDRLGMDAETIMLLINRVAEDLRRRYGEGRLPTMHAIEREAFAWARREILTPESALEYLSAQDRSREKQQRILSLIQLRDRMPSPSERAYLESWAAMDFGDDVYALAYDRMVSQIGKFNWKYMNSILLSWQEKGLKTVAEIEKGDGRQSRAKNSQKSRQTPEDEAWSDDLSLAEKLFNRKG